MINKKLANDRVLELQRLYRLREYINNEVINKDYPDFKVTDKTKEDVFIHPGAYLNCDSRIRMGKFYTDQEYKNYKKRVLSRPLP
ncbi:MAG: hypothetical protein J5892_05550 [Bacilli bacterium]|nr:hypothetical protein [Bacilli bacterium]